MVDRVAKREADENLAKLLRMESTRKRKSSNLNTMRVQ